MKKTLIALSLLTLMSTGTAEAKAKFDDYRVNKFVDSAFFTAGKDTQAGVFAYIVDRTTGLCFMVWTNGHAGGPTQVKCDSLKKISKIKTYLETGETPE